MSVPYRVCTSEERHARRVGLGDAVAFVATPVARVLRLPCIDPATGKLRPKSGCAKRQKKWNAAVPNLNLLASLSSDLPSPISQPSTPPSDA